MNNAYSENTGLCVLWILFPSRGTCKLGMHNQNLQIQAVAHCTLILTVRGEFSFAVTVAHKIVRSQLKLL